MFGRNALAAAFVATTGLTALVAGTTAMSPVAQPPASGSLQQILDQYSSALPFDPVLAAYSCPVERGPVKEGADADRDKVATSITYSSIKALVAKAKPAHYPTNNRIAPVELRSYQLSNVHIRQYLVEADGDIHLVIKDSVGRHMIAEIPYGSCVPTRSPWKKRIAATRAAFVAKYKVTTDWHYIN